MAKFKIDGYGDTYIRKKKTKPGETGRWNEKKRYEVITTYLATGSPKITESLTTVPVATINRWKKLDWWKEMEQEIREAEDLEMSTKLKNVVEKSLDAVNDRLENGDYVWDGKRGHMVRVPVKLRDVHRVLGDTIDKRRLLQKQPNKITQQQTSMDDRLAQLAQQFAQFVNGKEIRDVPGEIIEGDEFITEVLEIENAIHEEREEGLQERVGVGAQEETQSS